MNEEGLERNDPLANFGIHEARRLVPNHTQAVKNLRQTAEIVRNLQAGAPITEKDSKRLIDHTILAFANGATFYNIQHLIKELAITPYKDLTDIFGPWTKNPNSIAEFKTSLKERPVDFSMEPRHENIEGDINLYEEIPFQTAQTSFTRMQKAVDLIKEKGPQEKYLLELANMTIAAFQNKEVTLGKIRDAAAKPFQIA